MSPEHSFASRPSANRVLVGTLVSLMLGTHGAELCAAPSLLVQAPATMDRAMAGSVIGAKCKLGDLVADKVYRALKASSPELRNSEQLATVPAGARAVKLTIVNAIGFQGGSWSGEKSVLLRAELVDAGGTVASRTFSRRSTGGVFGPLMNTCDIFERAAKELGDDVALWLSSSMLTAGSFKPPESTESEAASSVQ